MRIGIALWLLGSLAASAGLAALMFEPETVAKLPALPVDRTIFLPGETTHGHYQIELDCNACHGASFADADTLQAACMDCHGAELERVDDSHPRSKFTDPRNADRVASLDARACVTCHQEHRPEITATMGLSLPGDYCYRCHQDIGEDRPTHAGLAFDSCASAGCHNFHDNQALYEDFLVEHRDEPMLVPHPRVPGRNLRARAPALGIGSHEALRPDQHDAPAELHDLARWVDEWAGTRHAKSGVNCRDCHAPDETAWIDVPSHQACAGCHGSESEGFLAGRHGMRLAAGLPPMKPELARLPMHPDAAGSELDCNTCHTAHVYDTRWAAADACLGCHVDDHSRAFEGSPHEALWQAERAGAAPAGSGVSCATCHLPRLESDDTGHPVAVAHNQNDFLRPNEKMIRAVCMECHGLGFSIDALADSALVANNFRGRPAKENLSIHYAATLRWELEGRSPPWSEEQANPTKNEEQENER